MNKLLIRPTMYKKNGPFFQLSNTNDIYIMYEHGYLIINFLKIPTSTLYGQTRLLNPKTKMASQKS